MATTSARPARRARTTFCSNGLVSNDRTSFRSAAGVTYTSEEYAETEVDRDGSFIEFAKRETERAANRDPRPSIERRYASREEYVRKVKETADALVADRLLLQEDADAYVKAAQARRW